MISWHDVIKAMALAEDPGLDTVETPAILRIKKVKAGYDVTIGICDETGEQLMDSFTKGKRSNRRMLMACVFADCAAYGRYLEKLEKGAG